MALWTDFLFYCAVCLGILIFFKLSSRRSVLERIVLAAITTIILFLVFLFLSTLIALILTAAVIIFILSFLKKKR